MNFYVLIFVSKATLTFNVTHVVLVAPNPLDTNWEQPFFNEALALVFKLLFSTRRVFFYVKSHVKKHHKGNFLLAAEVSKFIL